MFNYYRDQLSRLKNSEYFKGIKIFDGNGSNTNQMNLNVESIPIIIDFLKKEQERLEREAQNENQTK